MAKRTPIKIGAREFKFKKDVVAHYRKILHSYDFGQSLNDEHYNDLLDLFEYDDLQSAANTEDLEEDLASKNNSTKDEVYIEDIKIAKVQFNTKCFEVFYSDQTSDYVSYLMIINNAKYTPEKLFYVASRNTVRSDIQAVKQAYFDENSNKGAVKCQETGILSKWEELVVDHRQPNSFSMIVERFKEVNRVDLLEVKYTKDEENFIIFEDSSWAEKFRQYHSEKASLRIVRSECNSGRTGMGRIKRSSKDLTVMARKQK